MGRGKGWKSGKSRKGGDQKDTVEKVTPRGAVTALRSVAGLAWRAAPGALVALTLLTGGTAAAPVATAWLTRLVLDRLVGSGIPAVLALAVGLAAVGLAAALLPSAAQYVRGRLNRAVGLRTLDRLYAAVNSFGGLARFEDPVFQDRLRMAQSSGTQAPALLVGGGLRIAGGVLTAAGFFGALLVVSPLMTVVVVVAAFPALLAQLALSRRQAAGMWVISSAYRREFFYERLLSSLEAAKEVRLFGIGDFLRDRMLGERRGADAERHRQEGREFAVQGALAALSAAVAGAGLIWAVLAAGRGTLSVGDVSMFVAAVVGVQGALSSLVESLADGHQQLLMFGHYTAVIDAEPDLPPPAARRPVPLPELRMGIELRDVWFRYDADQPWVLRGVNLFIRRGEAVGLVGQNGAGKSTLVKLLCRFYDPTRGSVLWDGVDIRDVPVTELRRRLSAVFQDYMSYELTAAENIAVGDLAALDDPGRIGAAALGAGVHDVLAGLPQGYDTMLSRLFFSNGDKDDPKTGVLLSGGQWQRVALARAFLSAEQDLLILDEPSSGLDAEAEHDIHTRLRERRAGRTSLLISHRLGTLRDADRIVVFENGRIAEIGDHATLLAQGGTYARLFTLQATGYRQDPAGITL